MMEENLRRGMLLSRGDASVFFTRPLSLAFLVMAAAAPGGRGPAGHPPRARGGVQGEMNEAWFGPAPARHCHEEAEFQMTYPSVYPTGATLYDPAALLERLHHLPGQGGRGASHRHERRRGAAVEKAARHAQPDPARAVTSSAAPGSAARPSACRTGSTSSRWTGTATSSGGSTSTSTSRTPARSRSGWRDSTTTTSGRATRWATMRPGMEPLMDRGNTLILVPQEPSRPRRSATSRSSTTRSSRSTGRATSSGSGCAAITSRSWISARRPGTSCSATPTGCCPAAGWATGCTSTPCRVLGPNRWYRRGGHALSPGQHHLVRPGEPTSWPSSTRRRAASSGSSGRITTRPRSCGSWAGSSASITPT